MIIVPAKVSESFRWVYVPLRDKKLDWAVGGTLALALHGLPVVPKRISVHTTREAADRVESEFGAYRLSLEKTPPLPKLRSRVAHFEVKGVPLRIQSEIEFKIAIDTWRPAPDFRQTCEHIEYDGVVIPTLSLGFLLEYYRHSGRAARVQLIEHALKK